MLQSFHLPFFKLSSSTKNDTANMTTTTTKKTKCKAYFWWALGGVSGFHHFYLGRDLHGFALWFTFGGCLGIGWIADLFYMNDYIAEANDDPEFNKKMKAIVKKHKKPPFSTFRFLAMILLAYFWTIIFQLAIPQEEVFGYNWKILYILTPIPCVAGIWVIGNVGQHKGGIWIPLLTAFLTLPLQYFMDESTSCIIMILAAAYSFDLFEKQWKPKSKSTMGCAKRFLFIFGSYLILCSLWGSYIYFNAKVTDQTGDQIPAREAIYDFFTSAKWDEIKQSIKDVRNFIKAHGLIATWKLMIEMSGSTISENNAYKILELTSKASQAEINEKCKHFSKIYHPDKFTDEIEKSKAQERFFLVQQACEALSSKRAKRKSKNKRSDGKIEL